MLNHLRVLEREQKVFMSDVQYRQPPMTDLERIARFRTAGYGGSVSDALNSLGVRDTVFSSQFKPLRQGMQLVGRALPIKLHSQVEVARTPEEQEALNKKWEAEGGHPQKRMMAAIGYMRGLMEAVQKGR